MENIKIEDLAKTIEKELLEYSSEVEEGLKKAVDITTRKAVYRLKKYSPVKTGEYRKGWGSSKTVNGRVIHNKKKGSITHLLENGHAKKGGGRVEGYRHIGKVDDELEEIYMSELEKVL